MKKLTGIVLLSLFPVLAGAGEIYQCTAADGSKSFQGIPCSGDAKQDLRTLNSTSSISRPAAREPEPKTEVAAAPAPPPQPELTCRAKVNRDYDAVPVQIEAYFDKRKEQCRDNFQFGSTQIENCVAEQEELRERKYKDLERQKKRSLDRCDD